MPELWTQIIIDNVPTAYYISSYGNIYSTISQRILKPCLDRKNGYLQVQLCGKKYRVHRLVAETFIPNPNNYPIVNHKDENKLNNHIENLEWCDMQYNLSYGTARARQGKTLSDQISQLYIMCNPYTGEVIDFGTLKYCSEKYNIPKSSIENCFLGVSKSAKGYSWVRKPRNFKVAKGDILQEGITKTPPVHKNGKVKIIELIDVHSKENPIQTFSTLKECAKYLHVTPATVSYANVNNTLVAKRYRIIKRYR